MVTTDQDEFPAGVPSEPSFPLGRRPLHEYVAHYAGETPERVAINYYGTDLTYRDLESAISSFATWLDEQGYEAGETLLLCLQNCPQYVIAYYGAQRLGMRVSPCSPMAKEHRLSYQLEDGDARIAVAGDTHASLLEDVRAETPLEQVVYTRFETFLPDEPVPAIHPEMVDAIEMHRQPPADDSFYFDSVLEETPADPPTVDVAMDDICLLQYTSGTTGLPKGCMHSYENVLFAAATSSALTDRDGGTRHLAVMPVFHVAGKLNAVDSPMIRGGTSILLTRYEAEAYLDALEAHDPDNGWITTPMVRELLETLGDEDDEREIDSLESMPVTSFGQALTDDLCERWADATGAEMYEAAYGLTETHTRDTFTNELGVVEEGFVGKPVYETDIVIRDWETHEELPQGETGEITVKTPSLFEGYLNKPEETEAATHDGYVLTGDIGRFTENGHLYFLGRRKYMIKSSGYSIAPAEVEEVLKTHPGIENAAVGGRDHETKGSEVVAGVIVSDESLSADAIVEWAEDHLAAYKRPRDVVVLEELPVTNLGKLDREGLADVLSAE
ncbi:AMP-binding protein [Natronorubrum daqingense]|uniref:Long-chain acyl-CoA synthetase n=1 Tax=Natronorubrum daqingense TaxID=588898 RepID=A0A1N7CP10_9EURY|nr:AMP-binding protein [Natronorubrum daqingense]SIR65356.1 long-chain acyl-CoA synthetase [Natronorubrum daqingense]